MTDWIYVINCFRNKGASFIGFFGNLGHGLLINMQKNVAFSRVLTQLLIVARKNILNYARNICLLSHNYLYYGKAYAVAYLCSTVAALLLDSRPWSKLPSPHLFRLHTQRFCYIQHILATTGRSCRSTQNCHQSTWHLCLRYCWLS